MFSSFRIFTLKTEPFNITVKRTRADFKWLGEKLVTEFPNKQLPNIDKGDLSKKVIEDYFHSLIQKEGIGISRYLNYFLTTDDRMFEERKNSEENFIGNLMGKLKRPGVSLEELGISDKQKTKVVPAKADFESEGRERHPAVPRRAAGGDSRIRRRVQAVGTSNEGGRFGDRHFRTVRADLEETHGGRQLDDDTF